MSALAPARWTAPARRRSAIDAGLAAAPIVLVVAAVAWRLVGAPAGMALAATGLIAGLALAHVRARRFDRVWLVRRLDALRPDLEDSADLLFAEALSPMQALQRRRLEARLAAAAAPDLRPAWSTRRILVAWALGVLALAGVAFWPRATALAPAVDGPAPAPGVPRLTALRLRVTPPAYTGLPARDLASLDARVPQGSRLEWTLRFAPQPAAAALASPDGRALGLRRAGGDWTAALTLDRSRLYRVAPIGVPTGARAAPLHRLEAVPDAPPQVNVLAPNRSLTEVAAGQRLWTLAFEAVDDYGVAPQARLRLTFAEGEGEDVVFHERTLDVQGVGPARRKRFTVALDYVALGFTRGGDLVAQLLVDDDRAPSPQTTPSASLILRWSSASAAQGDGLDGAVKTALPAYLRSERQIIIDAEALLRERRGLDAKRFLARSDGLGADQQGLRLRYSQFLGGENEHAENTLPTSDDDDATPAKPAPAPPPARPFGVEGDTLHDYGHAHDQPEADLLEPNTRAKLKAAVDQMFGAETRLRQGEPAAALPYANAALVLIKQVQQAERVFVAHTGLQPPPIDETRRLTGKRDGLQRDDLAVDPATPTDPAPAAAWRALAEDAEPGSELDLPALERWLRSDAASGVDRLGFAADIDAVRRDPRCAACRGALRARLWTALRRPPPHVARRAEPDAAGARYLDAMGGMR